MRALGQAEAFYTDKRHTLMDLFFFIASRSFVADTWLGEI